MAAVDIEQRLDFMKLGPEAQRAIRALKPQLAQNLPAALDAFYGHVQKFPETARFFRDGAHRDAAKKRQISHWDVIGDAVFSETYVRSVRTIGETHARIGLEPRWYIGGYALVLDALIRSTLSSALARKGGFGGPKVDADALGAALGGLCKAVLLDMDIAISVYLDAAEDARRKAEEEAAARTQREVVDILGEALKRLAQSDLTVRVERDVPPAFEGLKQDFNETACRLAEALASVREANDAVQGGATEIARAAEDLSRRTEQQAASLEQTAAALDEITVAVKRTAEGAGAMRGIVGATKTAAGKSGQVVTEAMAAMGGIENSSRQISQIIGVIDEIAFQTNLLALNAGVEAARAGDAGRGFAVVAQEVRALAQRSAEAAKEIKQLISNASSEVTAGVDLVRRTGAALTEITGQVERIDALTDEVASSAGEQARGLQEVNIAINQMDEVTQRNAAMVEETTAATVGLQNEADGVAALLSRFRLEGSQGGVAPASRRRAA